MKERMIRFLQAEWLQVVLLLLPFAAALAAMPFATHPVPMQWGLHGQVNWYAPPGWGLLVSPGALLFTIAIVLWKERQDARRYVAPEGSLSPHGKATRAVRLAFSGFLGAVTLLQIAWALGHAPETSRSVFSLVALLCAFMGNLFGKLKPNRYVGIRVPWTLNSEYVWRQTHRAAGWDWTVSSLVYLVAIWLLPFQVIIKEATPVWLAFLFFPPLWVAWREARAEKLRQMAA